MRIIVCILSISSLICKSTAKTQVEVSMTSRISTTQNSNRNFESGIVRKAGQAELKLDLEKIPPTALEVFDTHRKSPGAIGYSNSRELRSSKFSSNPEILSVLNEHRALFSEFVKSTDNFVELDFICEKIFRVYISRNRVDAA